MYINVICSHAAKDWVTEQTIARIRREMEADEREYEERLAQARKREELMRRASKGRVIKKLVCEGLHIVPHSASEGFFHRKWARPQRAHLEKKKMMTSSFRRVISQRMRIRYRYPLRCKL